MGTTDFFLCQKDTLPCRLESDKESLDNIGMMPYLISRILHFFLCYILANVFTKISLLGEMVQGYPII